MFRMRPDSALQQLQILTKRIFRSGSEFDFRESPFRSRSKVKNSRSTDIYSEAKRSEIMSRVRGRANRATEGAFAKVLREYRITGWRRHLPLPGRPDFAFPAQRIAVFVDGCFWHM